nr:ribonuclease H-like domain-containing protein [Tanacetum cinerariifolium]
MKMEHYLSHTDYPIWKVIQNGNGLVSVTTDTNGMIRVLPPKTAEDVVAREKKRKERTTLLMALQGERLAKFHKIDDAKEMWKAIKSRFSTTASSSNTQNVAFVSADNTSSTNDVSTAYSVSSFSISKSQKEGCSSYTDEVIHYFFANQSSAPKLDYDDLEQIKDDDMKEMDLKWQMSMRMKKFHKRTGRKLQFDSKDPVGFDKIKVECFNCHKMGHFAKDYRAKGNQDNRKRDVGYNGNKARDNVRRPAYLDDSKALVTIDEEDIEWSRHVQEDTQNYAMMAYSFSNSRFDNNLVLKHGIKLPSRPDVEIYYSKFTYRPKQTSVVELDSKPSKYASCESDSSLETTTSIPEPVKNAPKDKEKPSFAFTESVKHEKTSREAVKELDTPNHSPKIRKQDRNGHTRKGLDDPYRALKELLIVDVPGIKGEYSNAKTSQQNGVTERKNRTLIEAARTMLADLFLPTTFWVEAVNTACYVLNRVLVTKPQIKTPYELLTEIDLHEEHFVLPIWSAYSTTVKSSGDKIEKNIDFKTCEKPVSQVEQIFLENAHTNLTNLFNTISTPLSASGHSKAFNDGEPSYLDDPLMPHLEDIYASLSEGIFTDSSYNDEGMVTEFNNLETTVNVSPTPIIRIHTIHPKTQIFGDPMLAVQTRSKVNKNSKAHALICLLERKQLGLNGSIGTRRMKGEIEAIRIFLAFASYMGFIVYQMDVKSAFMYGIIDEEVYVTQPPSFVDPKFPNKVYKVMKALYGLHQAPRACVKTASAPIKTQKPLVKDKEAADVYVLGHSKDFTPSGCEENLQTIVATSTTEAEYVAAAHCCSITPRQSTLKSGTIEIRDAYEKKLIQVLNIHTANYVADLLTKAFDVSSHQFTMSNPHQELASPEANGFCKQLASPKQMALGKDKSNPFIADDAGGVECFPNEEIFIELAHMGYEKPPPKLMFHKAFFSAQWKFLMHTLVQCVENSTSLINDQSSHNNQYTSLALTQKVFVNMRRVEEEDEVIVPNAPTPPSPTTSPSPPPQDPIPTPPQAQPAIPPVSSPQEQPTTTSESSMTLLNTLMETWGKIEAIDADEDITLVDVDTQEEVADMDAELQGRIVNVSAAATKDVNVVEPTLFDDEEVTMIMAQTLIKVKAEKARLLDEQMAKRLHDEEENIDWNVVTEQIQEKHLDNIKKYRSLKRKPVSIAQAKKNMIIYLKNMTGYKMEHFRGMTYDKVRPIFEREYNKVQTLFKPDKDVEEPQKKKVVEEILLQESFKKLKAVEVSSSEFTQETLTNDPKEMSEEDVKNLLEIVPVSEFKVEAL